MLFHVAMTHTANDCPGYNPAMIPEAAEGMKKLEALAAELNVKVQFMVFGAPEHVAYGLLEADSLGAIHQFVFGLPMKQDFRVTPVETLAQVIAAGEAAMARAQK